MIKGYEEYPWAVNKDKLLRAIKEVRGDNVLTGEVGTKEVTEKEVKVVYVRLLGLLSEDAPVVTEEKGEKVVRRKKKK